MVSVDSTMTSLRHAVLNSGRKNTSAADITNLQRSEAWCKFENSYFVAVFLCEPSTLVTITANIADCHVRIVLHSGSAIDV